MSFRLTDDESEALLSFKKHCESTVEYIERILAKDELHGQCDEIDWVYADNARGIVLQADWNTMNVEIRTIQDMHKRYEEYKEGLE